LQMVCFCNSFVASHLSIRDNIYLEFYLRGPIFIATSAIHVMNILLSYYVFVENSQNENSTKADTRVLHYSAGLD